ncbi:glycosyltransferase [Flavobacterium azooxidireducens]|uniref:Glycosyltransferase n=1 Tax=Flavobacterium azooxidireducens TaxID=1871076 RepID=A0ABY4KFS5_9FLAO|nr:glycosyltransferase [Flavobacterium azooxidireducens]UPQ79668.1 glycosyltransferase [Flavobacterium azooxidireducens]
MKSIPNIRIIQLIDSLEPGGAERMAVSYANGLFDKIDFSGLVATRKEGALKEQLLPKVSYLFINKQGRFGLKSVLTLRAFLKTNKVNIIHAHGTSFFTAVLVKITLPTIKIIWHDHHGNRLSKKGITNKVLKAVSIFFNGVLTVNTEIEQWAKNNLITKKVAYFPNFISSTNTKVESKTILKGCDGKRIVFLANLKEPKNHLQILKAFAHSNSIELGWTLHLIGKDFNDDYSNELRAFIAANKLYNLVFIYDSCNDIEFILNQSNIGVLGSTFEGFPVTLLEYGKSNLAVISTNVGYCSTIIQDGINGVLFNPNDPMEIEQKLNGLIGSEAKRIQYATTLYTQVMKKYSDKAIIDKYLEWLL